MSVIRRLYNVAYGKVRLWQTGEDERPEPELEPIRPPRVEPEVRTPVAEPEVKETPLPPRPRRL